MYYLINAHAGLKRQICSNYKKKSKANVQNGWTAATQPQRINLKGEIVNDLCISSNARNED